LAEGRIKIQRRWSDILAYPDTWARRGRFATVTFSRLRFKRRSSTRWFQPTRRRRPCPNHCDL